MALRVANPRARAALAAGASLCLYLAPWFVPIAGPAFTVLSPAPLILLYRRNGLQAGRLGLFMAAGGAVAFFLALGSDSGGFYFLFHAALALVLGEAPYWGVRTEHSAPVAAGLAVSVVLLLSWNSGIFSIPGIDDIQGPYWQQKISRVLEIYQQSGLSPDEVESTRQIIMAVGRGLIGMAPGLLAGGALILAWSNLLLARRFSPSLESEPPLNHWRAPERLVWVLIPAGAGVVLATGFWFWTAMNLLLVVSVVYFFQGMAVLAFWLNKKGAPTMLKWAIYIMVGVEFFMAIIVAAAGLFDMWFNFRRLEDPSGPPDQAEG